jgi:RpiB/LacA/LacB family sugar-phosphate isomerase
MGIVDSDMAKTSRSVPKWNRGTPARLGKGHHAGMTTIVLGADHAGFALKQELLGLLRDEGHDVLDVGTHSADPVDYPDVAEAVAAAVRDGRAGRGVLVCGSGVGASVAANKIPGIRAAVCHDSYSAHQGVEHDDMNVLVLGGRVVGPALARELARTFVSARFSGEERHLRRLEKVQAIERRYVSEHPGPAAGPPTR